MKNYHYLLLGIAVAAAILVFNFTLVDWRIEDVNVSLAAIDKKTDSTRALGMVGKFELIKARIQEGRETEANLTLEARLQTLANYEQELEKTDETKAAVFNPGFEVVKTVVNGLRGLLGKTALGVLPRSDPLFFKLRQAYLWERSRRYLDAVRLYHEILAAPSLHRDVRSTVGLHLGFSQAMMNNFSAAREALNLLIRDDPRSETAQLARRLLDYLAYIEAERSRSEAQPTEAFEAGKRAFLQMNYARAIGELGRYQTTAKDGRYQESLYYLGRAFEESSQIDLAVDAYRKTIFLDETSPWADAAGLRLYLLAEFYLRSQNLSVEASDSLKAHGRDELLAKLAPLAALARAQGAQAAPSEADPQARSGGGNSGDDWVDQSVSRPVLIEADPTSARLYVDGEYVGQSPLFIDPGTKKQIRFTLVQGDRRTDQLWLVPSSRGLQRVRLSLDAGLVAASPQAPVALPENPTLLDLVVSPSLAQRQAAVPQFKMILPQWLKPQPPAVSPAAEAKPISLPQRVSSIAAVPVTGQGSGVKPTEPVFPEDLRTLSRQLTDLETRLGQGVWINNDQRKLAEVLRTNLSFRTKEVPRAAERAVQLVNQIAERQSEELQKKSELRTLEQELKNIQASGGVPKADLKAPGYIFSAVGGAFLAGMGVSFYMQSSFSSELAATTDPQRSADLKNYLPVLGIMNIVTGVVGGVSAASGLGLLLLDGKIPGDDTPLRQREARIKELKAELAARTAANP